MKADQRSVALDRVKGDGKKFDEDKLWHPYEGAPQSTIATLCKALDESFDILVLHDPEFNCLFVTVADGKIHDLACKIHHPKGASNGKS